jgi:hypothetical protein
MELRFTLEKTNGWLFKTVIGFKLEIIHGLLVQATSQILTAIQLGVTMPMT